MDPEEERVLYLTRAGHEKIIKRGTYDVRNARPITQNHPFYEYKSLEEGEAYLQAAARGEDEDDSSQNLVTGPMSEYASGPMSEYASGSMSEYASGSMSEYASGPMSEYASGPMSEYSSESSSEGMASHESGSDFPGGGASDESGSDFPGGGASYESGNNLSGGGASDESGNNLSGGGASGADDVSEANTDDLASEILSSNFKVGMSQSEVDDFLKGLLGE